MKTLKNRKEAGFSFVELIIAMTITLILLGIASTILTGAFSIRKRESQRTNALVSAQSALMLMSREIANCGYGIKDNGIVVDDSNRHKLHFRTNVVNNDLLTDDQGEDIIYYYDANSQAVLRYDRFDGAQNAVVINDASILIFQYLDYTGNNSTPTVSSTPSANTRLIRISVTITLDEVEGQPEKQTVTLISDVTLRNSSYVLSHY